MKVKIEYQFVKNEINTVNFDCDSLNVKPNGSIFIFGECRGNIPVMPPRDIRTGNDIAIHHKFKMDTSVVQESDNPRKFTFTTLPTCVKSIEISEVDKCSHENVEEVENKSLSDSNTTSLKMFKTKDGGMATFCFNAR